jgi:3D (Asp-Asp-Asp) domain-containing protein
MGAIAAKSQGCFTKHPLAATVSRNNERRGDQMTDKANNHMSGFNRRLMPAVLAIAAIFIASPADDQTEVLRLSQARLAESINHVTKRFNQFGKKLVALKDSSAFAKVTITAYHPVKEQCDETPWITASGTPSRPGRTMAVSRYLKKRLNLKWGDLALVPRRGLYVVQDLMNARFWDDRVDLMIPVGAPGFKESNDVVFLRQ